MILHHSKNKNTFKMTLAIAAMISFSPFAAYADEEFESILSLDVVADIDVCHCTVEDWKDPFDHSKGKKPQANYLGGQAGPGNVLRSDPRNRTKDANGQLTLVDDKCDTLEASIKKTDTKLGNPQSKTERNRREPIHADVTCIPQTIKKP